MVSSEPPHAKPSPLEDQGTPAKVQDLLGAKDDTTRFVGLAFLRAVLDHHGIDRDLTPEATANLRSIWSVLSPVFLDRLLRALQNQRIVRGEARDMVDLAVAIIQCFVTMLPDPLHDDEKLLGRRDALLAALVDCPPETATKILQVLIHMATTVKGAETLLQAEDLSALIEIAPQQSLALDVWGSAWTMARNRDSIDQVLPQLMVSFKDTDSVSLIAFVASLIPKLDPQVLPQNPRWLGPLIKSIQKLVTSRPTQNGRAAYTVAAATLLQAYPDQAPSLLFSDDDVGSKPFSYFFINLLLIDLRVSFPSLLSLLNTPEYPDHAVRLSAAFDVVSSFIGHLLMSMENDTLALSPDLLLKLRKDLAETMSLTVEYLRDRWDAAVGGAAGLHPESRSAANALTWDSKDNEIFDDVLILAAVRTLALWIREDDNDALRNECVGLADVLVALYKSPNQSFCRPVLTAMEAILQVPKGAPSLVAQGAWEVVARDVQSPWGIEVIRVLLGIIEDDSITEARPDWVQLTSLAAGVPPPSAHDSLAIELHVALLQLCVAIFIKTNKDERRRRRDALLSLSGSAQQLASRTANDEELTEILESVIADLNRMR